LRQALADASDGDTITFAVTGAIQLTSGELVIDNSITISGPGADSLAVFSNTFRIFHVMPGPTVTIAGLTIRGGFVQFDFGGGILNDHATLTLTNCAVDVNEAFGGGGIYNDGAGGSATLTIVDSTVTGNRATGGNVGFGGGGIYNDGSLTIINSTISATLPTRDFHTTWESRAVFSVRAVRSRLLTARSLATLPATGAAASRAALHSQSPIAS
jgi:hypothetical protein